MAGDTVRHCYETNWKFGGPRHSKPSQWNGTLGALVCVRAQDNSEQSVVPRISTV